MSLTEKSPEFTRKIYESPLEETLRFTEQKIDTSWRQQNTASTLTPRWVQTLSSSQSTMTLGEVASQKKDWRVDKKVNYPPPFICLSMSKSIFWGLPPASNPPLSNLTSYLALEQSGTQPGGTQGSTDYQIRATMETGSMVFTPTQGPVTSTLLAKPSNKFSQVRSLLN